VQAFGYAGDDGDGEDDLRGPEAEEGLVRGGGTGAAEDALEGLG